MNTTHIQLNGKILEDFLQFLRYNDDYIHKGNKKDIVKAYYIKLAEQGLYHGNNRL